MKFEKPRPAVAPTDKAARRLPHAAERLAHQRFGVEWFWRQYNFDAMIRPSIPEAMARFMESLPFFFIATANHHGECDCSFRGRECDAEGMPYPLLKVLNPERLIFPDFSGNNFFNSLGNILTNGQIGMLFIDFEHQMRVRVNGRAGIIENQEAYAEFWPTAQRYLQIEVTQAFANCQSRIPQMRMVKQHNHDL